jgi:hypothetical protein
VGEVANFVIAVFEGDCGGVGAGSIDALEQVGVIVTIFVPDVVVVGGEKVAVLVVVVVGGVAERVCGVGEVY